MTLRLHDLHIDLRNILQADGNILMEVGLLERAIF